MRSLSWHSPAAYIASLSSSGAGPLSQEHLIHAVELFNSLVPSSEAISIEKVLTSPIHQKVLSNKIDSHIICPLCPGKVLDPLGHHALTCTHGGDVVTRHNKLRDTLAGTCRRAHLSVKVEAGNSLTHDHSHTRPADILVPN